MERFKFGRKQIIGIGIVGGLNFLAFLFVIVTAIPMERLEWWGQYTGDLGPWSLALIMGPAAAVDVVRSIVASKQPKPPESNHEQ